MTPQEQIAYLRADVEHAFTQDRRTTALAAVCDLAERALLLEPLAQAVAKAYEDPDDEGPLWSAVNNLYEAVET